MRTNLAYVLVAICVLCATVAAQRPSNSIQHSMVDAYRGWSVDAKGKFQPLFRFTKPFGSIVGVPSGLQISMPPSNFPIWSPIQSCGHDGTTANELYADDPEQWTSSAPNPTWVTQSGTAVHSLLLEKGTFSGSGLVNFYFQNKLGTTARLYIGANLSAGSVTFLHQEATSISASSAFTVVGATQTQNFLSKYLSGTSFTSKTVSAGATPTPVLQYTVPNNNLITGQVFVKNLSASATFYIYADDCATACPSIANIPKGDGHNRRGYFSNAGFLIQHNFTPSIETSAGGYSWYDVVRSSSCVPALSGTDPLKGGTTTNLGDYGAVIVVTGNPSTGGGTISQYWFMMAGPSGQANPCPCPETYAINIQNLNDPATNNTVNGSWAIPFTGPVASPQPAATSLTCSMVGVCNQSTVLGLNKLTATRLLTYIPSGGDTMPTRFYYLIPCLTC